MKTGLKRYKISKYKPDPPNSIRVARPSKWGNPYRVGDYFKEESIRLYRKWLANKLDDDPHFLDPLKGKNLGCYCEVDELCHTDVILEFIKKKKSESSTGFE